MLREKNINEKRFNIKLIFPCKFESYDLSIDTFYPKFLPYGMGILTAFLRQHNYYVEQEDLSVRFNRYIRDRNDFINNKILLDFTRYYQESPVYISTGRAVGELNSFVEKVLDSIYVNDFGLIGFSIYSYFHFLLALLLSSKIKQKTNTPIVFGGPFITLCGCLYPEVFNFIDYMIVGDGGVPLLRLIDYLQGKTTISNIPNLMYRDNEKLITNPREDYLIDDIPPPDFTGLPLNLYKNLYSKFFEYGSILLPYQISQGCIGRCSFCTFNKCLKFKSYEKALSELGQMKERYKSKMFHFCDDAINTSYQYLEGLCDLFIKNKLGISWNAYVRVGNLNRHILRKIKEAGCCWLLFGIESGSDRILKMMNKGFTSEQASRTLRDSHETGLSNRIFLIAGYPHETQADIDQTIEFIRKNKNYIDYISVYPFTLFYNSPIYNYPEKYGIANLAPNLTHFSFAFDEIGGLKRQQKQEQKVHSQKQILNAMHNIGFYRRYKDFLLYPLRYFKSYLQMQCYIK